MCYVLNSSKDNAGLQKGWQNLTLMTAMKLDSSRQDHIINKLYIFFSLLI